MLIIARDLGKSQLSHCIESKMCNSSFGSVRELDFSQQRLSSRVI